MCNPYLANWPTPQTLLAAPHGRQFTSVVPDNASSSTTIGSGVQVEKGGDEGPPRTRTFMCLGNPIKHIWVTQPPSPWLIHSSSKWLKILARCLTTCAFLGWPSHDDIAQTSTFFWYEQEVWMIGFDVLHFLCFFELFSFLLMVMVLPTYRAWWPQWYRSL